MGEEKSLEAKLGQRIQQFRKKSGLTQQQLCNAANLSYSTLAKIERGAIKSPSVFTMQAISASLKVTLDDLVGPRKEKISEYKTSKNGVKFVYFDINGTLLKNYQRVFGLISKDFAISLDQVETAYWFYSEELNKGQMSLSNFNKAFAERLGVAKIDWLKYYLDAVSINPGIEQLIGFLSQNYHIGILSNNFPASVSSLNSSGKLPQAKWDQVIVSSNVGLMKPDKDLFNLALKNIGLKPNETLLIDDTISNLAAAEKAGWQALWFDSNNPDESIKNIYKTLEINL